MDKYGGSKVTVLCHENVKYCPIRIQINHGNSFLSLFYHRLTIYADTVPVTIAWGKIMRHKWSSHGKTMMKWSFCDLFLNLTNNYVKIQMDK